MLLAWIGDGLQMSTDWSSRSDGDVDALERLGDGPITVVNEFELREVADYADGEACSGVEAMLRSGASSGACLEAVGGRFVAQALPTGAVWGDSNGRWDLVVVAAYPNVEAFWVPRDRELSRGVRAPSRGCRSPTCHRRRDDVSAQARSETSVAEITRAAAVRFGDQRYDATSIDQIADRRRPHEGRGAPPLPRQARPV